MTEPFIGGWIGFLLPGAIGGFCNVCIGHPMDLIKVRQQMMKTTTSTTTTATATVMLQQPKKNTVFGMIPPPLTTPRTLSSVVTEAAGSMTTKIIPSPQIPVLPAAPPPPPPPPTTTTFGMFRSIVQTEGVLGLYSGVAAPLVAVIPAFAISFGSYEFAKTYLLSSSSSSSSSLETKTIQQQEQQQDTKQNHSIWISACAGAFSGIPLALVIGPTERIKCLMQLNTYNNNNTNNNSHPNPHPYTHHTANYNTYMSTVQYLYKTGGIRSLMKGTFLTICRDVPGNAVYFATYESLRDCLCTNSSSNTNSQSIPNTHSNNIQTNNTNIHTTTTTTTTANNNIHNNFWTRTGSTILAGGFAGVANWIVAIPIDVIKSRWQTSDYYGGTTSTATITKPNYGTVSSIIQQLYQTEGMHGFFRGITPALLRAFPANAACFLGAETTKLWLTQSS